MTESKSQDAFCKNNKYYFNTGMFLCIYWYSVASCKTNSTHTNRQFKKKKVWCCSENVLVFKVSIAWKTWKLWKWRLHKKIFTTELGILWHSVQWTLHSELQRFMYKITMMHKVGKCDKEQGMNFATWIQNTEFSILAYFHNCRYTKSSILG